MRDLSLLVQLYPDKTGKELLAIQEQDKLDDEKEFQKRNKDKLEFIEDINTNGGYYRSKFGFNQYSFYRICNLEMTREGSVIMDVESVVLFCNPTNDSLSFMRPSHFSINRELKSYQDLDQYGLDQRDRVTKKEWDEVNEYLNSMPSKFWGTDSN